MKLIRATLKAIVKVTLTEYNHYNYPVTITITDICLVDQQTIYCGQETNASPFNIHSSHIARMHLSVRCLAKTRTNQSRSRRNRSFNCLTAFAIAIAILLRRAARGRHSLRLLGQTNRLLQGPHVLRPLPRLRQLRAAQDLRLPTARRPILLRRVAQDVRVPCPHPG